MKLIDADKLKTELDAWARIIRKPNCYSRGDALHIIDTAPEVKAVPVVRCGEWIDSPTGDYAICSYCHVEWNVFDNDTYRFRHCPACGAKMEDKPCG